MFQNVRYAGTVRGGGTEGNTEYFVVVVHGDGEEFGAAFFVAVVGAVRAEFVDDVFGEYVEGGMGDAQRVLEGIFIECRGFEGGDGGGAGGGGGGAEELTSGGDGAGCEGGEGEGRGGGYGGYAA